MTAPTSPGCASCDGRNGSVTCSVKRGGVTFFFCGGCFFDGSAHKFLKTRPWLKVWPDEGEHVPRDPAGDLGGVR